MEFELWHFLTFKIWRGLQIFFRDRDTATLFVMFISLAKSKSENLVYLSLDRVNNLIRNFMKTSFELD